MRVGAARGEIAESETYYAARDAGMPMIRKHRNAGDYTKCDEEEINARSAGDRGDPRGKIFMFV